jgi:hypothetical protein
MIPKQQLPLINWNPTKPRDKALQAAAAGAFKKTRDRERLKEVVAGKRPACTTPELVARAEELLRQSRASRARSADRPRPTARRRRVDVRLNLPIG